MKIRILLISLVSLAIILPPLALGAFPQLPHMFYGTALMNEENVSVNTIIVAKVGDVEKGRITVTETGLYGGLYALDQKLLVQGDISDGDIVNFFIDNIQANETAQFVSGEVTEANLTFSFAGSTGGNPSGGGSSDTTAPLITDIEIAEGSDKAVVSWKTDESSISWIVYGKNDSMDEGEVKTTTYTTSHSALLENLDSNTDYYYRIRSQDSSGNRGYVDGSFTTLPEEEVVEMLGDINNDGKVDIFDFNLLMANWGDNPTNLAADINGDDKVDILDFNLLMINWTI